MTGSFFALKRKAGDAAAGAAITSHRSNARAKSSAMRVRAFCAFVVIGVLLGHFLWGPAYGRTSPTDQSK